MHSFSIDSPLPPISFVFKYAAYMTYGPIRTAVWQLAVQFDGLCLQYDFNALISWLAGLYRADDERCTSPHHVVYHVLFTHTHQVPDYFFLSVSILCLPHKMAYLPTNALSKTLVGDGQLLMFVIIRWLCVLMFVNGTTQSQSNWRTFVKVQNDF